MGTEFQEIFNRAADELFKENPTGERTFMEMWHLLNNKYGNEPDTRDVVRGFFAHIDDEDELYNMMVDSNYDFDLYYPEIKDKITWHESLGRIGWDREKFAEKVFDNTFLKNRLLSSESNKELSVQELPGFGERGSRFMVIDRKKGIGYCVKPYQGGWFEKEVMLAFSSTVGPQIYSTGSFSFVEELMMELDIPTASSTQYLSAGNLHPKDFGTITAHVFAAMHSCNVIFDAWNWFDEVRLKIEGDKQQPKILDFGSAYIWPHKDFFDMHPFSRNNQSLQRITARDLRYVVRGLAIMYGNVEASEEALRACQENYCQIFEGYKKVFAPVRERLAGLESPYKNR
ncbi:hypothetical protein ACFL96_03015 [Thermoproteota archaeon]